jgi:DNA/RNA-binding domain of Phe-tRNA-synthetase-like protein
MIFSVEEQLFEFFPHLQIGILIVKIDNTRYGDDILDPVIERVRNDFHNSDFHHDPRISLWSVAFDKLGMTHKPFISSVEFLLDRALKGGIFPRVNPVVDLLSAVSLEFLVPIGSHDMSVIDGNIVLGIARGYERFTPIEGGEDEIVGKGEVIYKDSNSALTRGWVCRQSNKDRVSSGTTSVFIPVDILDHTISGPADPVLDRLEACFGNNSGMDIFCRNMVNKKSPAAEFTI